MSIFDEGSYENAVLSLLENLGYEHPRSMRQSAKCATSILEHLSRRTRSSWTIFRTALR